jgi:deoxyhypusine synthase
VDPERLPDAVVAYVDSTVGLPLLAAYALAKVPPRPAKRLYARREELMTRLRAAYQDAKAFRDKRALASKLPGED